MNSNHFSLSDEAIESTYQARSIETDVGGRGGAGSSKKILWQANKNQKKANLQSHKNRNPWGRENVVHIFLFLVQFSLGLKKVGGNSLMIYIFF